jgi:Lamin Tail Domain
MEHGGLAQQGYPLTEPFQERSALNGQIYTVQYFERAIFEHHPENAGTLYEVLLSQVGKYELDSRYPNGGTPTATPPVTPAPTADASTATATTTATAMPAAPTPTEVGTNCEPVAENLKAPIAHTGDVFISNVEAAGLEYVEIRNQGTDTANLGGWTLRDKNEVRQHYIFDERAVLPGNMSLRVYTEPGHPYSFNSRRAIWNNCGDALELLDAAAHVVSTYGYGTHCAANCE